MTFPTVAGAVVLCAFAVVGFKSLLEMPQTVMEHARKRDAGPGVTLAALLVIEGVIAFFTASAVYFLLMITGVI